MKDSAADVRFVCESTLLSGVDAKPTNKMKILVNKNQWESASEADRKKIVDEFRRTGAIKADDEIVGDVGVEAFTEKHMQSLPAVMAGNPACEAACTASYNAATRVCTTLPHPGARAACYAAAMAAYAVCLRNCG